MKEFSENAAPAEDLAFRELADLIREKEESGLTMDAYIKKLESEAQAAARRVEVAKQLADVCAATKMRKPRSDKGRPRKKTEAEQCASK